ncbi:MAG: SDR family oxidoreductase [Saprospiraceae bacterium]
MNKTVLITGGNAGIGKSTAIGLAKKGYHVIIACRNVAKGETAVAEIQQASKNQNISLLKCDLSSFASIKKCAETFLSEHDKLDVLINNAGIFTSECRPTAEGYEMQFGVNHLGHFYLTHLLLEAIQNAPQPRIVNVSSKAHYGCELDFERFKCGDWSYSQMEVYRRSKLCNVLFTKQLAKRYPNITSHCLHPGVVGTSFASKETSWWVGMVWKLGSLFMISPDKGAENSIYVATSEEVLAMNGEYFDDKKRYKASKPARDEQTAEKLWKWSMDACGL